MSRACSMFVVSINKGLYSVSDQSKTSNPIEIQLTPTQKENYFRQTGLSLSSSLSLPPAQLKRLSSVAVKAGTETLPISRSAVKQVLEPKSSGEQGSGLFAVEVSLTPEQKEQIRQVTGNVFSSLRIVPDDVPVTYHETWNDSTPIRVGRTMVIKPADKSYETSHETSHAAQIIELPVGDSSKQGVFGTGRHPTTQLSLILLEEYVEPGDRVLDLGTGSGILAVAAAKLGASEVLALDIEAAAVAIAQESVSLNNLADVVEVGQGSIESAAPPYDVVAANIFPNVIIELAPELATTIGHAGVLITSGSVLTRAKETANAVCAAGFSLEKQLPQDNWVGMVFRKLQYS
jgi:ribosomal protein L11 methyltransferase